MAKIFTVETRGVGKPDYSREIAFGETRPGLSLKYRQILQIGGITFSPLAPLTPYPWIVLPLAAGDTAHLIDWETGFDLPYTCEAGYIYSIVSVSHSCDQDHALRAYFSTPALGIPLSFAGNFGTLASGEVFWIAEIIPFTTGSFDPTAAYEHQVDFIAENLGGADMEGSFTLTAVKEAIGTPPPPPIKTVKCKFCGHEWVVPRETTYIKCPECGEFNIYCDFSKIRELHV